MSLIERWQIAGMNCHYYNYSLKEFFQSMQCNGYESVALWGGAPHFFLDYDSYSDCRAIRKLARDYSQTIRCFTSSSGTYGYQIGMQPKEQAERCFRYFRNGIRAAAELEAGQMCVNSGWGYWHEPYADAWSRSRDMLARLAVEAEHEGIVLTMESLRRAESQLAFSLEETRRMLDEIDHPNLKAMIDTTAMGVAGETPRQWFEALGDRIVNTHFIDGTPYGHLVWGDGSFPLKSFLQTLKDYNYSGILGLEITARQYYENPMEADRRNMEAFLPFL